MRSDAPFHVFYVLQERSPGVAVGSCRCCDPHRIASYILDRELGVVEAAQTGGEIAQRAGMRYAKLHGKGLVRSGYTQQAGGAVAELSDLSHQPAINVTFGRCYPLPVCI